MKNPKTEAIHLVSEAIGDGNIQVHFKHVGSCPNAEGDYIKHTFEVNGIRFQTGWHDTIDCDFLDGVNHNLVSTHDINLLSWYLSQGDTIFVGDK